MPNEQCFSYIMTRTSYIQWFLDFNFLQADQPIRLQYSNQIKLFAITP